tara:strand:- start:14982 stop:15416 length:435 start_codon:yes stop_codon:yes gene_type:complete
MRNKKILLGFVETETGVHATYIFNREIQKERLSLFAQQGYSEKDLEFESLDDLLEDLTDNKVYFALAIFKEVFDWLESCVRDEDYELVKTNPEYLYLINPEIVIPCAFTQFNLEEYVKEWKVKEYLRNLFEEMNCLKEFEEDFR